MIKGIDVVFIHKENKLNKKPELNPVGFLHSQPLGKPNEAGACP
jgi:hypothetical protein